MQGLHVYLFVAFKRNEAYGRPCCRLGNRFGISVIILLCLDVATMALRWIRRRRMILPEPSSPTRTSSAGRAIAKRKNPGRERPGSKSCSVAERGLSSRIVTILMVGDAIQTVQTYR